MQVMRGLAGPGLFAVITDIGATSGTGAGSTGTPAFRGGGSLMDAEMGMGGGMYGPGGGGMYPGMPGGFRGFDAGAMMGPGMMEGDLLSMESEMMGGRGMMRPGAGRGLAGPGRQPRYLLREDRQVAGKEILQVTMGVDVYRFKRGDEEEMDLAGDALGGLEGMDGMDDLGGGLEEMPPDEDRPGEAGLPTEPAGDALTEPTGEVVAPAAEETEL
jgi:hypothetical protein